MDKRVPENASPRLVVRRRRQQRAVDTERVIIRAALGEFARSGFEKVSTRGIAQAADLPHSLVLHYFKSKEDLWRAAAKHAVDSYLEKMAKAEARERPKTAADTLRVLFGEFIRFNATHPELFRIMTQENALQSARLVWLVDMHVRAGAKRMSGLIAKAQREGAFVEGNPLQLLYLFVGVATSPYRSSGELKLLTGVDPAAPAMVRKHIAMCERLFFHT